MIHYDPSLLAVRRLTMLETVKFPTGISYLGASLADVDRDAFTLETLRFFIETQS